MLSLQQVIHRRNRAVTRLLTVAILFCCLVLVYAASFSSGVYNEYVYNYEVQVANGPNGFKFRATASLAILYAAKQQPSQDVGAPGADGLLVRLSLSEPKFYPLGDDGSGQPLAIQPKYAKLYNPEHNLYAHIVTLSNGTALVKEVYTHQSDVTTFKNIKKSILLNILPTTHHLATPQNQQQQHNKDEILEYISVKPPACTHEHDNAHEQPELFSPDSISQVNIVAKARKQPGVESTTTASASKLVQLPQVFQSVEGQQNVTLRSRVFVQAESNVTTKFSLELVNQMKSDAHERFDQANSLVAALKLVHERQKYLEDSSQLERERRICSTHHCSRSLSQLFDDYRDQLSDESMASVEAGVAYLRILDRLRQSTAGTSAPEILAILKKSSNNMGVESSLLDILAAARTRDSIQAALKHLRLPKNRDLDVAERFLSVLSVAAKTAAKMHLARPLQSPYYFTPTQALRRSAEAKAQLSRLASLEFIGKEFLQILEQVPAKKWASTKLRWSSLLTLATLVNANNQESNFETENDELNRKVDELLLRELSECDKSDSTDCRVVMIQALANVGRLSERQFEVLERQVIEFGRRESNAAMRVLRDLLQNRPKDKPLDRSFYEKLETFLLKVVYDHSIETTSRVLAAEMIVRFVPNSLVSEELLNQLPSFGNNELATMIYSRMQSLKPDSLAKHHENWYWKSCVINGTSTSFVKTMARTESLNASYGVNVELLNKGKMFKESSFDVLLDTKQRTQDLFSLGVFARGMGKLVGGDDGAENSADESLMAGMSLKLMGGYLRPYVFFNGYTELMGHYWSGTASEPTTAFNGNLLLIDHEEGYPLVSGFVVEQQMRGVLSIDVSGKIKINFWGKDSHSMVTTKASVSVQASQSVFTSYDNLWHAHLFSFGGQALIDFIADVDFAQMPAKTCLQVTQPEFSVRYNSRRHDQTMGPDVRRKITRQNYKIGAKSYSLNSENNKMCAALSDEL